MGFEPAPPGFEATEHLRNRMRKKTAENVFKGHVGWRGWWVHVSDSNSVYVCQALARAPVKSSHCSIEQIYVTLFAQSFFFFFVYLEGDAFYFPVHGRKWGRGSTTSSYTNMSMLQVKHILLFSTISICY